MSKSNYPKTTGWWTYIIKTPNNMYYSGYGGGRNGNEQPKERWKPNLYKDKSLWAYIEEFGWESLEKIVLADNLTKEQALYLEDRLICMYRSIGRCINKRRSGLIKKNNPHLYNVEKSKYYWKTHKEELKEKSKSYHKEHKEEILKQCEEYRKDHREELNNKQKEYYKNHSDERKQYSKQWRSTIEGRIYDRVHSFNQKHPDRKIETPLEAKQKYLQRGYIPNYIKNDDLV